jgi:hypothetical protein
VAALTALTTSDLPRAGSARAGETVLGVPIKTFATYTGIASGALVVAVFGSVAVVRARIFMAQRRLGLPGRPSVVRSAEGLDTSGVEVHFDNPIHQQED